MSEFNKKFFFTANAKWKLPESIQTFNRQKPHNQKLIAIKQKLNAVRAKTGEFDLNLWSLHTKSRDPTQKLMELIAKKIKPELLTQAWMKFYEILSSFQIINQSELRTLHLCEAPGAFIAALNHFLASNYHQYNLHYLASTLNPYYPENNLMEMVDYDRLIVNTSENWIFGEDDSGNLKNYNNYVDIICKVNEKLGHVNLVTADGGVNCIEDPENQEMTTAHLLYCEIITALSVLETEGTFIFKMFTMFEPVTISTIYLINCSFKYVTAFKPFTSKGGNSELYFICQHYKGASILNSLWPDLINFYKNPEIFRENFNLNPPSEFVEIVAQCADFFANLQINTIEQNLATFNSNDLSDNTLRFMPNWCEYFVTSKCKLRAIDLKFFVVKSQDDHLYQKYYRAMQKDADCFTKYSNFFFLESKKSMTPTVFEIIVGRKYSMITCSKFVERFDNSLNIVEKFCLDSEENLSKNTHLIDCLPFYKPNDFHKFEIDCLCAIISHLEDLTNQKSSHFDLILKNFVPLTYFSVNILCALRSQYKYFGCDPYKKEFIFQSYQCDDSEILKNLQKVFNLCNSINSSSFQNQNCTFISTFPESTQKVFQLNCDKLECIPYERTVVRFLNPKTLFLNDQIRLIKMYNKVVFQLNRKRKHF